MKKIILLLAAITVLAAPLKAQKKAYVLPSKVENQAPIEKRTCGTGILPDDYEQWLQPLIQDYQIQQLLNRNSSAAVVINIPVVVHVISSGSAVGTGTNISVAQVNSQIAALNEDFRRLNADTAILPAPFKAISADVEINFCLAQTSPTGALTTGINRINYNTAGFTAPPYQKTYIDATIKPATIWNPNNYLNLWVVGDMYSGPDQLLGYATFPASSGVPGLFAPFGTATTDGVVCWYKCFGRVGSLDPSYNKGRTTTHEIGHWMGLRHIWGDGNCATDYCSDTPTQQTANFTCPTYPQVTCNNGPNGDMFYNYMDYCPDACLVAFTATQKTRIQTVMANSPIRVALGQSTTCNAPALGIPVANFSANVTTVNAGASVNFTDLSTNSPSSWAWTFTGGTPSSSTVANPTNIVYNTPGNYAVSLTATNTTGSDVETKSGFIVVNAVAPAGCDTITNFDLLNDTVTIYNPGATGWGYVSGQNNYLDVAKADKYTITGTNRVIDGAIFFFTIGTSSGTGQVATARVWDDNGAGGLPSTVLGSATMTYVDIAAAATAFTPLFVDFTPNIPVSGNVYVGVEFGYNPGDTLCVASNQDGATVPGTAYEKFAGAGGWYPFTDTINSWRLNVSHLILPIVCTITGIDENTELRRLAIYPNPTHGTLNIIIPEQQSTGNVNFKVTNMLGAQVLSTEKQTDSSGRYEINLSNLQNGFYFLEISTQQGSRIEKIQVMH